MRTLGAIQHPQFTISVFGWGEKYIVKVEAGLFEQTYKFNQADFINWEELKLIFDEALFMEIKNTFKKMAADMQGAAGRYVWKSSEQ